MPALVKSGEAQPHRGDVPSPSQTLKSPFPKQNLSLQGSSIGIGDTVCREPPPPRTARTAGRHCKPSGTLGTCHQRGGSGRDWDPGPRCAAVPPLPPLQGALWPPHTLYSTRSCSPSRSVVPSGRISLTKAMEKIRSLRSLAGEDTQGSEGTRDMAGRERQCREEGLERGTLTVAGGAMAEGEPQVGPVDVLDGNSNLGGNMCQGEGRGHGLSPHLGNVPLCPDKGCAGPSTAANQPHTLPS